MGNEMVTWLMTSRDPESPTPDWLIDWAAFNVSTNTV